MRVPLVVSWPNHLPSGRVDEQHLVSGLDILPTFCDLANIDPPHLSHGRSLLPLLDDSHANCRDFLVCEVHWNRGRAVRSDRFKYVRYDRDQIEQLFDLHDDPWETKNLYADPEYLPTLNRHRQMLSNWEAKLRIVEPTKRPW